MVRMEWAVRNDRLPSCHTKIKHMKRELDLTIPVIALVLFIIMAASSCTVYITPSQAASGKAKCGRGLR